MKKPVIGITPMADEKRERIYSDPGYLRGIELCGGLPVMLPLTSERKTLSGFCDIMDGFLFTGGHDVSPAIYGEEPLPECGALSPERDDMEAFLLHEALHRDLPVFGICRGIQLFNALLGGTLYQDIPSQFHSLTEHQQKRPYSTAAHEVSLVSGTPLHSLLKVEALRVNSLHHQAVKTPAPGVSIMARSPDGMVEAICLPERRFVWAVQWHPEFTLHEESSLRLFRAFTEACRD